MKTIKRDLLRLIDFTAQMGLLQSHLKKDGRRGCATALWPGNASA
jgi:hypothetical protein